MRNARLVLLLLAAYAAGVLTTLLLRPAPDTIEVIRRGDLAQTMPPPNVAGVVRSNEMPSVDAAK